MKQTPRETQTIFLSVTTKSALRTFTMENRLERLSEAAGLSQSTALYVASSQEKSRSQFSKSSDTVENTETYLE